MATFPRGGLWGDLVRPGRILPLVTKAADPGGRPDKDAPGAIIPALVNEPAFERERSADGPLGTLRSPVFLRFWSAISLSLTGVWVRITAMGYLVYEITDDELKLGMISFAQAAPVLVTSPIAGSLLD